MQSSSLLRATPVTLETKTSSRGPSDARRVATFRRSRGVLEGSFRASGSAQELGCCVTRLGRSPVDPDRAADRLSVRPGVG